MAKRRASQQYNIEKDPLTTGRTDTGRLGRFVGHIAQIWGSQWSVGTAFLWLAVLLVIVWVILEIAGAGLFNLYLDRWSSHIGPPTPAP